MFIGDQRLTIPRRGLVGWWDLSIQKCYPGSGSTLTNLVSGGPNLTVSGTPTFSTGKPNGRVSVNNNTSAKFLSATTSLSTIQPTSAVTFSIWIKPNTYNASYNGVAGLTLAGQQRGYLFDTAPSTMNFQIGTGSWGGSATVARNATGIWTHYVGTWDGTTVRIYKNGVAGGTLAKTGSIVYTSTGLSIGRYHNTSANSSDMHVAHAAIWNRALSADEVTHLYNVTKQQFA